MANWKELLRELPVDSVPLTSAPERVRTYGTLLTALWAECGSGYYGGAAFHIFGDGYRENFHDAGAWNDILQQSFGWMLPDGYTAFAEDAFGNQFLMRPSDSVSDVQLLLIHDAEVFKTAASLDELIEKLLTEDGRESLLNYSFFIDCLTEGIEHRPGLHLTLRVPRVLGGSEELGMTSADATVNVSYLGQLHKQIAGLPPDQRDPARIRFKGKQ